METEVTFLKLSTRGIQPYQDRCQIPRRHCQSGLESYGFGERRSHSTSDGNTQDALDRHFWGRGVYWKARNSLLKIAKAGLVYHNESKAAVFPLKNSSPSLSQDPFAAWKAP
ncbi:conserved hypothetical protein [Ricinus communis]|uniref:Uncharacterized protein n=1 Tax=Ricinus communis TaxID=3988 RepID=B9SXB9_RICCO|nr:conserved hypothetical protein [Ricinus communis]